MFILLVVYLLFALLCLGITGLAIAFIAATAKERAL